VIKMVRDRIRELLTAEKYNDLVVDGFEMGKYTIIYGSILMLTFLGIITWIFGSYGFFSFILKLVKEKKSPDTTSVLNMIQMDAILLLDLFLLSVVLFIVAIGLYGIFIKRKEGDIRLPVKISNISELERYVFGTIVAILIVNALTVILSREDVSSIKSVVTIALTCAVIKVVSVYLAVQSSTKRSDQQGENEETPQ
jgi:uncharacterized membrane protein YqhA